MKQNHLLVISSILPSPGTGSGIVLLRHLRKLAASGWKITVCVRENEIDSTRHLPQSWKRISIPFRKWWWPPVREQVYASRVFRSWLLAKKIKHEVSGDKPTAILTLLWGDAAVSAAFLARMSGVPVVTVIHDQEEFWATSHNVAANQIRRNGFVIAASRTVLAVSDRLLRVYNVSSEKGVVLYPISGDEQYFSHGLFFPPKKFVIYYAGSLHPWQSKNFLSIASRLSVRGGHLVFITAPENEVFLKVSRRYPDTERLDPPRDNDDVVREIARKAYACLVSYSIESHEQPWAASSFPSKLVDFSRAGVPILILAPRDSAIGSWCLDFSWKSYASNIDTHSIDSLLDEIDSYAGWCAAASQVRAMAKTGFSSEKIQGVFENSLIPTQSKSHTRYR